VPDDENLKEWTISCQLTATNERNYHNWLSAERIFSGFESALKTKNYSRFIVTSDRENISELVHLKSYHSKEKYEGVYDVEITVTQHKPESIKTTGVPYVARPGKIPLPAKVTITSKNTAYKVVKKYSTAALTSHGNQNVQKPKFNALNTGKPVTNDANIKPRTTLTLGSYITDNTYKTPSITAYPTVTSTTKSAAQKWLESVGTAISNAFTGWQKNANNTKLGK
jgi:hypothetical protein